MAILWSYGGIKLAVEKDTGDIVTPRIDAINPVATILTTYLHYSGTEALRRTITAVFFQNYEDEFLPLVDGAAHALVSDQGTEGDYVITAVKPDRLQDIKRDLPVVRATIELVKA